MWDLGENSCTHELLPDEEAPVRSVTMSSDGGLLIAANNKGHIYAWRSKAGSDTPEFDALTRVYAHQTYVTKCLLSPDNRYKLLIDFWQLARLIIPLKFGTLVITSSILKKHYWDIRDGYGIVLSRLTRRIW